MEPIENFLHPRCTTGTLHNYKIRHDILKAITKTFSGMKGVILDVGCGMQPYRTILAAPKGSFDAYVGMDMPQSLYHSIKPDVFWDGATIPFPENSFNAVLCSEVLEHTPNPRAMLAEMFRVLKPGGTILITTPFFWPLHEVPNDYQRLTPYRLQSDMSEAGFTGIRLNAHAGWDGSLATMLGLWVTFRPLVPGTRFWLKLACKPIICFLSAIDRPPKLLDHCEMITGMSASAGKRAAESQ